MVAEDEEKAELSNAFSATVFNSNASFSLVPELKDRDGEQNEAPHNLRGNGQ